MTQFTNQYYSQYKMNGLRVFVRDKLNLSPKVSTLFKYIKNLPEGATALDAGCGTGGMLELMERENTGLRTTGIDVGQPPEFRAKAKFINSDVQNTPFDDNSFDVVTCSHVIEHLKEPFIAINELIRVCKPGGMIYIEAPSQRSAMMPVGFSFWDDPTHVRPYTATALARKLRESGLEPVEQGVKKSIPALLFGLPYMIIGRMMGDEQARAMFPLYLSGLHVYAIGKKGS